MAVLTTNLPSTFPSLSRLGVLFAWVAVAIYAASNSVVTSLVQTGADATAAGAVNPITFPNLLLLGSLLSLIPLILLFRHDLTRTNLRALTGANWRLMTLSAFLSSALTPGLFFYALSETTVTNVVLISRIEPPLFLLAAWMFLGDRFAPRAMIAGLTALTGALLMIALQDSNGLAALGTGEWAAIAATLSYIASTLVTRQSLRDVPMGIFSVYRTLAGALMYVILAMAVYGPDVFNSILSPLLWSWIWIYAGLVIVVGQVAWGLALKYASSGQIALATSASPLMAILIAAALLGETLGAGLLPGAALILLAIWIGWGQTGQSSGLAQPTAPTPPAIAPLPMVQLRPAPHAPSVDRSTLAQPFRLAKIGAHWKTIAPKTAAPPGALAKRCLS